MRAIIWISIVLLIWLLVPDLYSETVRYIRIHTIVPNEIPLAHYLEKPRIPLSQRTVVALGPDPSRIDELYYTLYSVVDQSHRVDEIEINLPVSCLLPDWLEKITRLGSVVQIKRYSDVFRNVSSTIERYKNQDMNIIVVHDQILYRYRTIFKLCNTLRMYPHHAVTGTGYRLERIDGTPRSFPYVGKGVRTVDSLMSTSGYIFNAKLFDGDTYETIRSAYPEFKGAEDAFTSIQLSTSAPIISLEWMNGLSLPRIPLLKKMVSELMNKHSRVSSDHRTYQTDESRTWATNGYKTDPWYIRSVVR